jgi:DNA-binding SARP family transcriptional activator
MDFRILGPVEALYGGRLVRLGGSKQRALLALFLLHANETLSTDRLIDELWGQHPPATAAKTVQVHISRLRKALAGGEGDGSAGVVVTREHGYELELDPERLDAHRFERLVAEGRSELAAGRPERAASVLEGALSLWRGPPMADLAYEPFAQREIARLDDLRAAALEQLVEAQLALGAHAELVGQLATLIGEHPYRERLRAQLMLALYRCDRQADALQAYQDARKEMVEELGIEPGERLRELERAILAQDPGLHLAASEEPAAAAEEAQPKAGGDLVPEPVAREVRKTVTAVCVALVTSSPGGDRLDPESLRHVTSQAYDCIRAAVEHHGGTVVTVAGDAITAVFGVPIVREDDALRAVRAAEELRVALGTLCAELERDWGARLQTRTGVSTGEVVAATAAEGPLYVVGDAVNAAARLAQAAAPEEILVGGQTEHVARGTVSVEPVEPLRFKGANEPVPAFRLLEVFAGRRRLVRQLDLPLVGRSHEQGALEASFERALRTGNCQLVTVLGAAGVGKSRLVEEFALSLGQRVRVLRGRCPAYGEGITYWPIAELVRDATSVHDEESLEVALTKLEPLTPEGDAVAAPIAAALGLSAAASSPQEAQWAVRKLLEGLAAERPVLVLLDDVHWAETTLLELIEYVVGSSRAAPILMVCLARAELIEAHPDWLATESRAAYLRLEPLAAGASRLLIEQLLGESKAETEAIERIIHAAEGNPLFIGELLRMLIDDGLLRRVNGKWVAAADLGVISIPPTIGPLLAARLDRLTPKERAVIDRASIIGEVFSPGAVGELCADTVGPDVGLQLETLLAKELIRPVDNSFAGEGPFRFGHILIRDVAYASIPKALRAELHERFGAWLEKRPGAHPQELDANIGYHLEQAHRCRAELGPIDEHGRAIADRAGKLLARAGRSALRAGDAPATVHLLQRALSLLSPRDPLRIELMPDLAGAIFVVGALDRGDALVAEAIESARVSGENGPKWHAILARDRVSLYADPDGADLDEITANADHALAVFGELGDDQGLSRAWAVLGDVNWMRGRVASAGSDAQKAADHARRAGSRFEEMFALSYLGWSLVDGPASVEDGLRGCQELLHRAEGNPGAQAELLCLLGALEAMLGRFTDARRHAAAGLSLTQELGWRETLGVQKILSGEVELLAGNPVIAEARMREAVDILTEVGDQWFLSTVAVRLPRVVYAQGRYDDAFRLTDKLFHEAPASRDLEWQIRHRSLRAKLLARRGSLGEAVTLAQEAVSLARQTDFLNFRAEALVDLAEVFTLARRPAESQPCLDEALDLYDQKGNLVAAANVRTALMGRARHAPEPRD